MSTSLFDGLDDLEGDTKDLRLAGQLVRVYEAIRNHEWWSLRDLSEAVGGSATSMSARIRDLRKDRFGGFTIDKQMTDPGLYRYRLVPNSGNPDLVYMPAPEPYSRKAEARAYLIEYVETVRARNWGNWELIDAIEEMLK